MEIFQHHRIAEFKDLGIGQTRVCHVRVHGIGSVEARSGRGA
jgi:hypothetical protein